MVLISGVWNNVRSMITGRYASTPRETPHAAECVEPPPLPHRRGYRRRRAPPLRLRPLAQSPWFRRVLYTGEDMTDACSGSSCRRRRWRRSSRASDISPNFKANGSTDPDDAAYRSAGRERLRRLEARGRRAGRDSRGVLARRSSRHAGADPDHAPRLRRGLELHRQMDRRPARERPRAGAAQAEDALHPLHLRRRAGKDARRQRPLLRDASTSRTPSTRRRSSPTT